MEKAFRWTLFIRYILKYHTSLPSEECFYDMNSVHISADNLAPLANETMQSRPKDRNKQR